MIDPDILQRLASGTHPSDAARRRIHARMQERIGSGTLRRLAQQVQPNREFHSSVREQIAKRIAVPRLAGVLPAFALLQQLSVQRQRLLRERILSRLHPQHHASLFGIGLKWAAALAIVLLSVRMMPVVLLVPHTQAETSVQLLPTGDVSMLIGGVWVEVTRAQILQSPVLVRTGNGQATITLHDDAVLRLQPNTSMRLNDLADRPLRSFSGPTVTLVRGTMWVSGLIPPAFQDLSVQTSHGIVSLNTASLAVEDTGDAVTLSVYDKGAIFIPGNQQATLLTAGERLLASGGHHPLLTENIPSIILHSPWVTDNLDRDAVHRDELAQLQQDRRQKLAGILPTSILYPAKRMAEEVDVLFTLGDAARTQKRIEQADTRLNEALALLQDGDTAQASQPLQEYRSTLLALASGSGDNLVKALIEKQVEQATVSVADSAPTDDLYALKQAVLSVSSALPDADLKPQDIQGYVLVDKLTALNQSLVSTQDLTGAIVTYNDLQPYIQSLLATGSGANPLLQKEATSLLVSTSSLVAKLADAGLKSKEVVAMQADLGQYLPPEPEKVLVTEDELNKRVDDMITRILLFKAPRSRYNQLENEMHQLVGDPNRGTLLRRLYHALPDGLSGYVRTEIQQFGDELSQAK